MRDSIENIIQIKLAEIVAEVKGYSVALKEKQSIVILEARSSTRSSTNNFDIPVELDLYEYEDEFGLDIGPGDDEDAENCLIDDIISLYGPVIKVK